MQRMLIGYKELTASFARLARDGALSQAYCFAGDRGIGKATFAAWLAAHLEHGSVSLASPSRERSGPGASRGGAVREDATPLLDATTLSPDEHGTIGIDAIRGLRRFLWQTPFRSSRRVAIVDDAETLTPEAQGALLKIVEEPPPHALLLLVTSQADLLTPPLRSRLSIVHVPRLPMVRVEQFLAERRGISVVVASRIAARSFGSIGRALTLAAASSAGTVPPTEIASETDPGVPTEASARPRETSSEGMAEVGDMIERMLVEAHLVGFAGYPPGRPAWPVGRLAWLAERLELVRRFNVNPELQKRAVKERLGR